MEVFLTNSTFLQKGKAKGGAQSHQSPKTAPYKYN